MFKRITAPETMPVSVPDLLEHLRQDDEGQEALLTTLIRTAYQQAEHLTGRPLLPQTWKYTARGFPRQRPQPGQYVEWGKAPFHQGHIKLMPDLTAVTSVTYTDPLGVQQTLASDAFYLDGRRIYPVGCWPQTQWDTPVVVTFDCGYFAADDDVSSLCCWMKLFAATLYENAEVNQPGKQILLPRDFVNGLLDPYLLVEA
ncbi:hypothetical protein [Silvimonas sp.]|uniref:hypothetical protein n=1 Tax=Silvimonas sp. TaxID=2650811 RepID=UPI002851A1B5|nr:hypothetical protein [Silvimonas sp.]MDR3427947.1 hypothetical protein [Silvimonas sp.]